MESLDVIRTVIGAADLPWRRIFALCLETGARVNEIVYLSIADVAADPGGESAVIRIQPHVLLGRPWRPKRPASVRAVRVPLGVSPLWPLGVSPGASAGGTPGPERVTNSTSDASAWGFPRWPYVSAHNYYLRKACVAVGLAPDAVRSHDFRRARITAALLRGVPPVRVSRAAGHKSLFTTLHYVSNLPMVLDYELQGVDNQESCSQFQAVAARKNWSK